MFRRTATALTTAALLAILPAWGGLPQPETRPIVIQAPVFKTKAKNDTVKFTPFKAKEAFQVTLRLFAQSGLPVLDAFGEPWSETHLVSPRDDANSAPAADGTTREPGQVDGTVELALGSITPLPTDITQEGDVSYTTQVTTLKNGEIAKVFEPSPRRPLGLAGYTEGLVIAPAAVQADDVETFRFAMRDGASAGQVLTSDSDGDASWQPLPDLPGVSGTVNRLAVFDSDNSIGNSSITDDGAKVTVQAGLFQGISVRGSESLIAGTPSTSVSTGDVVADNNVRADLDVFAGDDLVSADDTFVGDDLFVTGNSTIAGNALVSGFQTVDGGLTVSGNAVLGGALDVALPIVSDASIRAGSPDQFTVTNGDVAATDDLIADDDLFVGGGASIDETLSASDINVSDDLKVTDDVVVDGTIFAEGTFIRNAEAAASDLIIEANDEVKLVIDRNGDNNAEDFEVWDGVANPDIGNRLLRLTSNGNLLIDGNLSSGGADLAEYFPTRNELLGRAPGTVVAIDPVSPENVRVAALGSAEVVVGIVPTEPGVLLGTGGSMGLEPRLLREAFLADAAGEHALARQLEDRWETIEAERGDRAAVALAGRVPVLVDLSGGPIAAGDRLGLSLVTPGLAARYAGQGPVVGIAMAAYDAAAGAADTIVAFVLVDHSPDASWSPANVVLDDEGREARTGRADVEALSDEPADASGSLLSGAGVLPAGFRQVVVEHRGIPADGLPVVTFYGNPGSLSWVSERGDGWFVIELEEAARGDVRFGYTVSL